MKLATTFFATVIATVVLTSHAYAETIDANELQARGGAGVCHYKSRNCKDTGNNAASMAKGDQYMGCASIYVQSAKYMCSGCSYNPGNCRQVAKHQCVDMMNGMTRIPYDCLA